jgi:rhodanese-related sulfurtransferase
MRRARQALIILLAALVPGALAAAFHPLRPAWSQETLAPGDQTLATALAWGNAVLWVDARSAKEFETEHIPGALLLNMEEWDRLFPQFLDRWDPEKKIVVYCGATSCDLSREVAERLRKSNIPSVYVLKGGWEAWKARK